ncbi:MAG: ribonuclease HII [Patescibacteria group bacterium]|jgi:ribonuclease HII
MFKRPTFEEERALLERGYRVIVGCDEVGCGALAGPVVSGAVVLPLDSRISRIHDSKLLSPKMRENLYGLITERAIIWSVGIVSVNEIMEMGIRRASLESMHRAVTQLGDVDFVLVDAWAIPNLNIPQKGIVHGDRKVKSIAAASILAKVTRDRMMQEYDEKFPEYGFAVHKGYGTKAHRDRIEQYGPCPIHRLTFRTFNARV